MLKFPQEFLMKETREGFTIDATMKSVWAAELEVLSEIAKVCENHGLVWSMAFGSLLGAVRHEGFVPWDDDIDIWMKREDYMELLQYLPQELPEGYVVKSPMLESSYPEFQSCVMNSESISVEPEHLERFHGCPFIVGIDIFPLDYLAEGENGEWQQAMFKLVRQAAVLVNSGEAGEKLEELLSLIEEYLDVTIERTYLEQPRSAEARDELASGLWGLANEVAMCGNGEGREQLVMYLDYFKYQKVYPAEWFAEVEELPFEGFSVPVPVGYDGILRRIYGDYTVRVKASAQHNYPFYKEQLELLRKHVAEIEEAKRKEGC